VQYLFDTSLFELYLLGNVTAGNRVRENVDSVFLSSVAAEEFLMGRLNGINRARSGRNSLSVPRAHDDLAKALADIQLFPLFIYNQQAEAIFQGFPASIRRVGQQDCRIAAQALAHGMTVVTRNLRDFEAIGAPCVDWSE
jgi:predicted nucleic acid-binding protein